MKEYSAWRVLKPAAMRPHLRTRRGSIDAFVSFIPLFLSLFCRPTFPQVYIDGEFYGGCDITVGERLTTLICEQRNFHCQSRALTPISCSCSCVPGRHPRGVSREGSCKLSVVAGSSRLLPSGRRSVIDISRVRR